MQPTFRTEIKFNHFGDKAKMYPNKVGAIVRKAANDVVSYAAPNTPIDTGFLLSSVQILILTKTTADVIWAAMYAFFQEMGTRYIPARLFASGAAEQVWPQFVNAIKSLDP